MTSIAPTKLLQVSMLGLLGLLAFLSPAAAFPGTSTHYWDCCMPSCAWPNTAPVTRPVLACGVNDDWLYEPHSQNACVNLPNQQWNNPAQAAWGDAFTCRNTVPYAKNDQLAYGFAAVKIAGQTEWDTCCACYHLTFTSTSIAGKEMIVQATNTGNDLVENQFDLMMPGGGVGVFGFHACQQQWGNIDFGNQYGGFQAREMCDQLPPAWRDGCYFQFDWYENVGDPTVDWYQVECPAELTEATGCSRT